MAPKIIDKQEKRNKIIEAAVKVFARLGFPNTKMLAIAEAAGIGKGTIYEYFKSKEDLFVAVINAYMQEMDSQIARRVSRVNDPAEKLKVYFEGWMEITENEFMEFADIFLDIWAAGLRESKSDLGFDLNKMYGNYRVQITDILNDGIRKRRFKSVNTAIVSSIIIGTLDGLMIQWIMDRNIYQMREAIQQLSDIIIDGLTRGS